MNASSLALLAFLTAAAGGGVAHAADPWASLPASYQNDLARPLDNLVHHPWLAKAYGDRPPQRFHRYYFNQVLSRAERQSLVLLYAKLKAEGLWRIVRTVKWVGDGVAMLFEPTMSQPELRRFLAHHGYGDWWFASKGHPWGLRSRFGGPQLHFRGGDFVNVHLDLNNPGDPSPGSPAGFFSALAQAFRHLRDDLQNRAATHTHDKVRARLAAFGVRAPQVD